MAQQRKRVHVVTAINAKNVSKEGDLFVIRNACGAVDDIVMHGVRYPGPELANGAPTLNDRVAPIGHPKNAAGQYISAYSGEALLNSYAGAVCRNARHEGGRTVTDLHVNIAMAKAHPKGAEVVKWCESALNGEDPEPMHVSTGLIADMVDEAGEVRGKKYTRVATNIRYDHLALLPGGQGAGTPEEGVGMFNDAGAELPVETFLLNAEPEDRRFEGVKGWLMKLLANGSELSFEQISSGLWRALPDGSWVREVFARYAIWTDREGRIFKQDYSVSSDGSVAFSGTAEEVREKRTYEAIVNHQKGDPMKDMVIVALNAAGINTEGLSDAQLLAAYNAHVGAAAVAPVKAELDAANSKLQANEAAAKAAEAAELATLATELAANSKGLTAEDFTAMGLARCKALKAAGTVAAPVVTGNAAGSPAASFDLPE